MVVEKRNRKNKENAEDSKKTKGVRENVILTGSCSRIYCGGVSPCWRPVVTYPRPSRGKVRSNRREAPQKETLGRAKMMRQLRRKLFSFTQRSMRTQCKE